MKLQHNINCAYCRNNRDFDLPQEIINSLLKGNLVIFAGSGISTEGLNVFPYNFYDDIAMELDIFPYAPKYTLTQVKSYLEKHPKIKKKFESRIKKGKSENPHVNPITFYDDIAKQLGINPAESKYSFPQLMTLFEKQPDGRKKLLIRIKNRIDYVKSFNQTYVIATQFHRELSKIHQITEIITTNWDDFFERECDAIPFVFPQDFAFWDLPQRKVFKIHGSINNLSTIIASEKDYARCYKNLSKNILGSYLKLILSTKTIVFLGYSLNDYDFNKIYSFIKKEMKEVLPHSYIVSLDENIKNKINTAKTTPINTDATFFIHTIYRKLVEDEILIDDSVYDYVRAYNEILYHIHDKEITNYKIRDNYSIIYTYSYQDGLADAFHRGLNKKNDGLYLCQTYLMSQIDGYKKIRKDKLREKKYWDVAYVDGYISGLYLFLLPDKLKKTIPLYYIFGYPKTIKTKQEFDRLIKSKRIFHESAYKYAIKFINNDKNYVDGIVPQHTAFLL